MNRTWLVKQAIEEMDGNDFEPFICELLARDLYPGLNPTSRSGDLGEDARTESSTLFLHREKRISLATSKESDYSKVTKDCDRCKETGRNIDILIFVTAGNPQGTTTRDWKKDVKNDYGWELEVKTIRFLAPFASRPEYEDLVDDFLHIPPKGGDFLSQITNLFRQETKYALNNISVTIPGIQGSIERAEVKQIEDQLDLEKSVVLTGEAGTGKSGIARQLALNTEKTALFLDARRLGRVQFKKELSEHINLNGPLNVAVRKTAKTNGCRVIIDQLDNSIGLPISSILKDLLLDIKDVEGLDIIVVSRKREAHEIQYLDNLLSLESFVELTSKPLSVENARKLLTQMGVSSPGHNLINLGRNLLNLTIVGKIHIEKPGYEFGEIASEVELWNEYVEIIKLREKEHGEKIIGEAMRLAKIGLHQDNRTFALDYTRTYEQKRLESWNIIIPEHERVYRFYHEKLQDYLYAVDAHGRGLSLKELQQEVPFPHRTRNIYIMIVEIYKRNDPSKIPVFLREAWNVHE